VVGVLGAAALLASYLPARRASRIPPVEALRAQ
jgi:ABC-type lipoprotein release transport system permease subunit